LIPSVHVVHEHDLRFLSYATQYRDGFVVDDGPYRRLDDPANGDFLRAIAVGRTPRELLPEDGGSAGDVVVGLVDKREEDYVETFRSFSGAGNTLGGGSTATSADAAFDPATLPSPPPDVDAGSPTTSIAVRLLDGNRKVVKINLNATVQDLASHLVPHVANPSPFRLVAGFPPTPLSDPNATIEAAGLKGAQVQMQKA
jgi:UBX domain-containing protein 1